MRVTHRMLVDTLTANLADSARRLQKVQDELSSGQRLRRPSDDPPAVAKALTLRDVVAVNDQYLRNIDISVAWLNATDSSLGTLGQVLLRAKELAVQGANGALGPAELAALGQEVDQLLGGALQVVNSTLGDDHLFAGYQTATLPFSVSGSTVVYAGDGGAMQREIGKATLVPINVTGDRLVPIVQALADLRGHLVAGDQGAIVADVGALDTAIETNLQLRAAVGARINRFEFAGQRLQDVQTSLAGLLSEVQDVDFAEAITRFMLQENVYKAALTAGARAVQPSLLDFLR